MCASACVSLCMHALHYICVCPSMRTHAATATGSVPSSLSVSLCRYLCACVPVCVCVCVCVRTTGLALALALALAGAGALGAAARADAAIPHTQRTLCLEDSHRHTVQRPVYLRSRRGRGGVAGRIPISGGEWGGYWWQRVMQQALAGGQRRRHRFCPCLRCPCYTHRHTETYRKREREGKVQRSISTMLTRRVQTSQDSVCAHVRACAFVYMCMSV
jgi:hypothetical protein